MSTTLSPSESILSLPPSLSLDLDATPPPITRSEPPPWRHQCVGYNLARECDGYMLGYEPGAGKTRTAIDLIQNGFDQLHQATLIICPKAVMATWPHEISKHAVQPWPVHAMRGSGNLKDKVKTLQQLWELHHSGRRPFSIVINYDNVWREPFKSWALSRRWGAIICDESHRIKSPQGKASKAMDSLRSRTDRRIAMTGTPVPHSPLDIYGQFRFLDPNIFGKSFTAFRIRYADMHPMFPSKVTKWKALEELSEKLFSRCYRVRTKDVLDLPDTIDSTITITLSAPARKVYDSLRDELIAAVAGAGGPDAISAANALVQLLRLQQITGGSVRTEAGVEVAIDDGKRQALTELAEDIGPEPIVVFCRFKGDIQQVKQVAAELGIRYGELSGSANDLDGNRLGDDWRGKPGLFAVQVQSGGAGVDLTASSACVYWSLGFSLGEYEQSRARQHRPGQSNTVRYWHLVAEDTVDEVVYHALRNRAEVVGRVLRSL